MDILFNQKKRSPIQLSNNAKAKIKNADYLTLIKSVSSLTPPTNDSAMADFFHFSVLPISFRSKRESNFIRR